MSVRRAWRLRRPPARLLSPALPQSDFRSSNCRFHVDTSNGEKRRLKHDRRNRRRFVGQGRLARGPKARTADRISLEARLKEPTGPKTLSPWRQFRATRSGSRPQANDNVISSLFGVPRYRWNTYSQPTAHPRKTRYMTPPVSPACGLAELALGAVGLVQSGKQIPRSTAFTQPFVKHDLACSRNRSVPFSPRNETVSRADLGFP